MSTQSVLPPDDVVIVYGADWCGDCRRAKRLLEATGTPYRWIDLARDRAAQQLVDDAGFRAIPVIVTPAGRVLVEPSDAELLGALQGAA